VENITRLYIHQRLCSSQNG